MTPLLPADLSPAVRHVESVYPQEGCGIFLRHPVDGTWRIRPMANAYDRYHALDPVRFPRTSRTAYFFDPKEWLQVSREAEQGGEAVACVYHSHVEVGAYFSQEDMAMAAPDGEPLLSGVSYLVFDVRAGVARSGRLFWWEKDVFRDTAVAIQLGRNS